MVIKSDFARYTGHPSRYEVFSICHIGLAEANQRAKLTLDRVKRSGKSGDFLSGFLKKYYLPLSNLRAIYRE